MESESANGNRESPSEASEIHVSAVVFLCVFSFLIFAGNLLTIVSILQFTKRKNTFSLLIIALSLTEVLNVLGPNGIAFFYTMFSMSNKKSFSTKFPTDVDLVSSKQQIAARDVHTSTKELSRMVALVVVIYFCCILPWMVAISLGIFAVDYPPLFGLCAIQLPMISGFLNPLLYGILWPPYRRAYIRTLKWPGTKCCNRKSSSRTRSHTLNSSLSTNHSFWLSDSFAEEDADHENAFHILFGPTSYIKPLDFNPEELEMFEQNSKLPGSSKPKRGVPQQTKGTVWRETGGNHFQNILDLIDAMTDGKRKNVCEIGLKANSESSQPNEDSAHIRSVDTTSTHTRRHCSDLELSFGRSDSSLIPGVYQCREHRNGSTGCSCLGKSKCYLVQRKTRELDYLVSKDMEHISSLDSITIEI
ncbi:hypothetical protein ACROYT_G023869 [Oculina patagonica]